MRQQHHEPRHPADRQRPVIHIDGERGMLVHDLDGES
jgi:hypothetical protein